MRKQPFIKRCSNLKLKLLIQEMYWFTYSYVIIMIQHIIVKSMKSYNHWNPKTREKHPKQRFLTVSHTQCLYRHLAPALKLYEAPIHREPTHGLPFQSPSVGFWPFFLCLRWSWFHYFRNLSRFPQLTNAWRCHIIKFNYANVFFLLSKCG